jgi:hypothetical protein
MSSLAAWVGQESMKHVVEHDEGGEGSCGCGAGRRKTGQLLDVVAVIDVGGGGLDFCDVGPSDRHGGGCWEGSEMRDGGNEVGN